MLIGLVKRAIGVQLGFHLVVRRQRLGLRSTELARRLALRESEVVDPVFGHDARRGGGNARAHFLASRAHGRLAGVSAAHGRDSIIESRPFMAAIAAIAKAAGYRVTGCDANVYPPMSDQLRSLGIELTEGYGADQVALA